MLICIVKVIVARLALALVGTNLLGFSVRGLFWAPPRVDAPTDRVAELFAQETRRMCVGNFVSTAIAILAKIAYFVLIYRFLGAGVLLAVIMLMLPV